MKWMLVIAVLVLALPSPAGAQGTLDHVTIYSDLLGMERDIDIYRPQGYDPAGGERYPVIYFLHGTWYNCFPVYWTHLRMKASLDSLIAIGQIDPLIMVTPDGLIGPYDGSYWTNSSMYGPFEDFVVEEVVAYIDANYRTIPTRAFRAVQGLSMGGYGAMKLGLLHPVTFRGAASHSGEVCLCGCISVRREAILAENPGGPPYQYQYGAGEFTDDMFTMAGAFSPNPLSPGGVDLPYDEWGDIVPDVMERWRLHGPPHLATLLPPYPWPTASDLDVYFDCGTIDDYLNYPLALAFADSLDALGIPYDFRSFVGGHVTYFPQRFSAGLARAR
jgi:S-formylglutathione hydrolase